MRQVLFHIPLDPPWFGFGILLAVWALIGIVALVVRLRTKDVKFSTDDLWPLGQWIVIAGLIIAAPRLGAYLREHGSPPFQQGLPLFGYGFMLFVAVATGGWWATVRAQREHLPSEKVWDLAFCLFLSGIVGARLFYLIQYPNRVLEGVTTVPEFFMAVVNLSKGGIVLYGGLIAAAIGFFSFCAFNRFRPLALLDIITPSIFLGIGFGRIGCFLNGCCYGDETTLPWGVSFPRASATFGALVEKNIIPATALCTPPLHPTQIYSAIDGFVLAALTAWYFSRRRRNGEVFAIGLTIYPITRFLIEFIRGDEPGLFGTRFTISQWVSALMFVTAIGYIIWLSRRPPVREPVSTNAPPTPPTPASSGVAVVARS